MAYGQATITSANPGLALADVASGLFTAAGWTQVAEFNFSGTSWYRVFASSGSLNEAGYDMYAAIRWNATGSGWWQILFGEGYDSVNRKLVAPVAVAGGNLIPPVANFTPAQADGTSWGPVSLTTVLGQSNVFDAPAPRNNVPAGFGVELVSGVPAAYWLKITRDSVAIGVEPQVATARCGVFTTVLYRENLDDLGLQTLPTKRGIVSLMENVNTPTAIASNASSVCVRPVGWNGHAATLNIVPARGTIVPVLSGGPLPTTVPRPNFYINAINRNGVNGFPIAVGQPVIVGRSPDGFILSGGNLGDTINIDGVPHVILVINPIGSSNLPFVTTYYAAEIES